MTDAIQEQAAMELAWRTEAKAADLKPEDRALIERELVLAILSASHQQPMTSPTAVSDVLSTPQVRSAIEALTARAEGLRSPSGGGDLVATIEIALRNSLHWQNPDAVDKTDHAIHLSGGVTPASSGCTLDLRDIAQDIANAIAPPGPTGEVGGVEPVAWRSRQREMAFTGQPGPWNYWNGNEITPASDAVYEVEPLFAAPPTEIGGVPEGWVLVPREPKPEMVAAFWRVKNGHHFADEPPPTDTSDYAAYRAMIAAAPPSGEA